MRCCVQGTLWGFLEASLLRWLHWSTRFSQDLALKIFKQSRDNYMFGERLPAGKAPRYSWVFTIFAINFLAMSSIP